MDQAGGMSESERLLRLTLDILHDVIEGDDVQVWQMEELASDIGDALQRYDGEAGG